MAGGESIVERALVDELRARHVEHDAPGLCTCERRRVEQPSRLGSERTSQAEVVTLAHHRPELMQRIDGRSEARHAHIRRPIAAQHAHTKGRRPCGGSAPSQAQSHDAHRRRRELAVQRAAHPAAHAPGAVGFEGGRRLEEVVRVGEHAEHEVLGHRGLVRTRVAHRRVGRHRRQVYPVRAAARALQKVHAGHQV